MFSYNTSHFDFVLFGVIERISRFYRLVHDMKYENMDYYIGIIDDFDECLWNILAEVISATKKDIPLDDKIKNLLSSCNKIKTIHENIGCLPIMDQQVELLRFQRLFRDGIKQKVSEPFEFSIGFAEKTVQAVHLETPLSEIKNKLLDESFKTKIFLRDFDYLDPSKQTSNNPNSHVTLPRIEFRNPLAWPIIAHEISHRLIDHCFPEKTKYLDDFKAFIEKEGVSSLLLSEEKIKHNVLEYWCDFLGTLIMGSSFGFSQCDAMFFDGVSSNINETYPPKYLRLWLVHQVLVTRLTQNTGLANDESFTNSFDNTFDIMKELLINESKFDNNDVYLVQQFSAYLKKYIFHDDSNVVKLEASLESLLDYFKSDNYEVGSSHIRELLDSLKKNFIIPSYRISTNDLEEKSTNIQDILLAGFIFREKELKNKILSIFRKNIEKPIILEKSATKTNIRNILNEINSILDGFDTCLLRSIQVSEYINLLTEKNKQSEYESMKRLFHRRKKNNLKINGAVLNDEEIKNELIKRSINLIPLIDKGQIGSTSVDVRLGTSFQIYKPNQSGILDLISTKSVEETLKKSTLIDLDFLEEIILVPGQFVLGHTMEYLVLPKNIAAELEGRSSYARLGIEIHMTAGFIDPGFNGVLTLELFNAGPNPVKIYPGLRIGQLRFFRCTETKKPYDRNIYAKYKGLLKHNESLLVNDYEIEIYKKWKEDKNNKLEGVSNG